MTQCKTYVPDPLARNLPEFLPTFRVGTPAICIVFDIFIGEDCFECPASMIKIQHILSEKSIGVKSRKEQFIDPLIDTLADFYEVVGRSEISGDNHPSLRKAFIKIEPAAIKKLDNYSRTHAGHIRCGRVGQNLLDVGVLQKLIPSPSRHKHDPCKNES